VTREDCHPSDTSRPEVAARPARWAGAARRHTERGAAALTRLRTAWRLSLYGLRDGEVLGLSGHPVAVGPLKHDDLIGLLQVRKLMRAKWHRNICLYKGLMVAIEWQVSKSVFTELN
jgi:hypothetical protein